MPILRGGRRCGEVIAWLPARPTRTVDEEAILRLLAQQIAGLIDAAQAEGALGRACWLDPLTGIPNRRVLADRLSEEVDHARQTGRPLSLLLADVDGLRQFNGAGGHRLGDVALTMVARALQRHTVPPAVVARYGGDEFAVLLPGVGPGLAEHQADRYRRVIADLGLRRPIDGQRLTLSVGAATAAHTTTPAKLIDAADAALAAAKQRGRQG